MLADPIAQMWGLPTSVIWTLVYIFFIMGISGVAYQKTKNEDTAIFIFIIFMGLGTFLNWISWIIMVITLLVSAWILKSKHMK